MRGCLDNIWSESCSADAPWGRSTLPSPDRAALGYDRQPSQHGDAPDRATDRQAASRLCHAAWLHRCEPVQRCRAHRQAQGRQAAAAQRRGSPVHRDGDPALRGGAQDAGDRCAGRAHMGLRSSEVLQRVVRDLDDGARHLGIDQGKTANARRHLEVPEPLQPYFLRRAEGKQTDEFLFALGARSRRPCQHQRLREMVHSICRIARVPRVCTHSLRGLWATLAVGTGVASHAVAESLGHPLFAMTRKHSAQPSAITNAGTARVAVALEGPRPGGKPGAEELLRQLDRGGANG